MTIVEAAAGLAEGHLTARDLVEQALSTIERENPRTHAFIRVDADGARRAADESDRRRVHGGVLGPLDGIPISLKDLIDVAGDVTTAGSRVLEDRIAPADAPVVTRLREAGGIVLGKTNLHEFALGTTSEDSAFGPVRHPADVTRVAGGSSGGSAVAVATGMGLASVGSDTGGSIRIPAAACGVVGLKPSRGEVPLAGVIPLSSSFDHLGPLAQTTEDAGIVLDVLAGRPISRLASIGPMAIRLVWLTGYFETLVQAEVAAPFGEAIARLRQCGVAVTAGEIGGTEAIADAYVDIVLPEAAEWHAPYLDDRVDRYSPVVRGRISSGRDIPATAYVAARRTCLRLRAAVDEALEGHDALVLPTLPIVAPPIGATGVAVPSGSAAAVTVRAAMLRHTQLFNMTGHPAISVPVPASWLPVGLQLVGGRGATRRLLEIAAACEKILGAR